MIEAIDGYQEIFKVEDEDIQLFHTVGVAGLTQALAKFEHLQSVFQGIEISNNEAMALIGLAQQQLGIPVKVNGHVIKGVKGEDSFHKLSIEYDNIDYKTYTSDIRGLVEMPNLEEKSLKDETELREMFKYYLPYGRVLYSYTELSERTGYYEISHMPTGYDSEVDVSEDMLIYIPVKK